MKLRKDDKVKVITGKDSGKTGKILKIFKDKDKVVVEGVNVVKRHVKPGAVSKEGGIISIERPISVSNVMYYDEKLGRPVKLGSKVVSGKFYRFNRSSKEVLEK